jgi:hypothetical protein
MNDVLNKTYQRLHSITWKNYSSVGEMHDDLDNLLVFIEKNGDVDTLGLHAKGDDGVWKKIENNQN